MLADWLEVLTGELVSEMGDGQRVVVAHSLGCRPRLHAASRGLVDSLAYWVLLLRAVRRARLSQQGSRRSPASSLPSTPRPSPRPAGAPHRGCCTRTGTRTPLRAPPRRSSTGRTSAGRRAGPRAPGTSRSTTATAPSRPRSPGASAGPPGPRLPRVRGSSMFSALAARGRHERMVLRRRAGRLGSGGGHPRGGSSSACASRPATCATALPRACSSGTPAS